MHKLLRLSFSMLLLSCGAPATGLDGGDGGGSAGGSAVGGGVGGGSAGGSGVDGGACAAPTGLGRGQSWVRQNPMFISGLSVGMGAPPVAAVNGYYDDFHATATHLWANGLPVEATGWADAGHPGFRYVSWVDETGKSYNNALVLGGLAPLPGRIGYRWATSHKTCRSC